MEQNQLYVCLYVSKVTTCPNFTVFWANVLQTAALCSRTVVCPVCPILSVCDVGVLWPNGWMNQDATWYGGRPRPRPHGDPAPSPPRERGREAPSFRPMFIVAMVAHLS